MSTNMFAITTLDGRYASKHEEFSTDLTEAALHSYRLAFEAAYALVIGSRLFQIEPTPERILELVRISARIYRDMYRRDPTEFDKIHRHEQRCRHDVKAVEYYMRDWLPSTSVYPPLLHYGITSEDTNSFAYALLLLHGRAHINRCTRALLESIQSHMTGNTPMMGRTHGQPATPTTVQKFFSNYHYRIATALISLQDCPIMAKLTGATGGMNCLKLFHPDTNFTEISSTVLMATLALDRSLTNKYRSNREACVKVEIVGDVIMVDDDSDQISVGSELIREIFSIVTGSSSANSTSPISLHNNTTQVEPCDELVRFCGSIRILAGILLDLVQDMWLYRLMGHLMQPPVAGHVGSSTMPHKVNPIDFEQAKGMLEVLQGQLTVFENHINQSWLQRDLSGSTMKREISSIMTRFCIVLDTVTKALTKVQFDAVSLGNELSANWQILMEPVMLALRKNHNTDGYEIVRDLSIGAVMGPVDYHNLLEVVRDKIHPDDFAVLSALTPETYL